MTRYDSPYMPGGFQVMPPAIKTIIAVNVAIYLLQIFSPFGEMLTTLGALWPIDSQNPEGLSFRPWQLVTYMFLHSPASFSHLFFNMFALWIFGAEIENYWGTRRFTTYYFICGIGAAIFNLLTTIGDPYSTIGASGAIFGVLVAFGMMFPDRYIFLYFLFPVKAKYFVTGYALIEFISGLGSRTMGSGSNVAHFAHLGGAIIGFLYIIIRRNEWTIAGLLKKLGGTDRNPPKGPTLYKGGGSIDEVTEEEIDAILDKISSRGYGSLTPEEKRKLLRAGGRN